MKVERRNYKERHHSVTAADWDSSTKGHRVEAKKGEPFDGYIDREEINSLLRELDDLGMALSRYPSKELIHKYRLLVRQIIALILEKLRVKREYGFSSRSNKIYTIVERTESSLSMLEDALNKEREKIVILNIIEEIKGCLISLLL